jgi:arylsulfatase
MEPGTVTVAQLLKKAGYATAFYGKAHLGDIEASYLNKRGPERRSFASTPTLGN